MPEGACLWGTLPHPLKVDGSKLGSGGTGLWSMIARAIKAGSWLWVLGCLWATARYPTSTGLWCPTSMGLWFSSSELEIPCRGFLGCIELLFLGDFSDQFSGVQRCSCRRESSRIKGTLEPECEVSENTSRAWLNSEFLCVYVQVYT